MKSVESEKIARFLADVRAGHIIGTDAMAGPGGSLRIMCNALDGILHGEAPDSALGITRQKGNPPSPYNAELVEMIFWERVRGVNWAAIESAANTWLNKQGQPAVTLENLKRIFRESGKADTIPAWHRFMQDNDGELPDWIPEGFY